MNSKTLLLASLLAVSAGASAQHNWHLTSTYHFELGSEWGSTQIDNMLAMMQGEAIDMSYGWGSTAWSFNEGSSPITLTFDTDWFDPFAAEPVLRESLMMGVATDLPGDPPGQKHVLFFMDTEAASNIDNIAWGTIFTTTLEAQLIDAIERATTDFDDDEAWDFIDDFVNNKAKNANVGPGGLPGSIWFGPNEDFSIVAFSEAKTIGGGSSEFNTEFQPVPEPATMTALSVGALALLRRKRR